MPELRGTTERKLIAKIDWRLMPSITIMYLLAFIDRVNIANAEVFNLSQDLHIDQNNDYNTALGKFPRMQKYRR